MKVLALRRKTFFPDRRGKVFVHRMAGQLPMEQHRHEFFEIAVVLSGSGTHVTGHRHQRMEAGDVFVINNRRTHGFEDTRGLNLINILIRTDLLPRLGRELQNLPGFHALFSVAGRSGAFGAHVRLSAADLAQVEDWADRLEEETHRKAQGGYLLAEAYLTLIIGVLCWRYGRQARRWPVPGSGRAVIGRTLNWLEKNLAQSIRIADMARHAGMSERNFHRTFRQVMAVSPGDYLKRARMRHAADLLRVRNPSLRISEVAASCGYDDSNYFSRLFCAVHGVPPRKFQTSH